jgi:quinol monooxygenase YgiN
MLIVAGTLDVDPGQRDEFLAGRKEGVLATRSEPGCIEYVFSADLIDPGRVRIFERWESKDALAGHLAAMSQAPRPTGPGVAVLGRDLVQYEIASQGPLGS